MSEVTIDNYKITGIIGRGGMGAIYYGEDLTLKRPVAIKMVRPELLREPLVVDRFRSEAITTAKLNHPNIATVYELIQQNHSLQLVMEYVRGWTLSQVLRIYDTVPAGQAIAIIQASLAAIGYAHRQGVIHRDLKPTNLMLNDNGIIKVMDFGIARVLSGPKYTRTGQLVGTLKYMPPEQIRGEEPDARTDIYALGIVMYKLITGRVPFSADSDYQLMKAQVESPPPPPKKFSLTISDQLQAVILKALSKSSKDRFADTALFSKALATCPESRDADPAKLDEMVRYMQQRHPLTTTPLNRQAVETLQADLKEGLKKTTPGWHKLLSAAETVRQTVAVNNPFKEPLPAGRNWRRFFTLSVVAMTLFVLVFWVFLKDTRQINTPDSHSEFMDETSVDPYSQPTATEESDTQKPPQQEQQETGKWIIER